MITFVTCIDFFGSSTDLANGINHIAIVNQTAGCKGNGVSTTAFNIYLGISALKGANIAVDFNGETFHKILVIVIILVKLDDTLTLDREAVKSVMTAVTKVMMPVHRYASTRGWKALNQICEQHNSLLLEDPLQTITGTFEGKPFGGYIDLGCFSFDYVKTQPLRTVKTG